MKPHGEGVGVERGREVWKPLTMLRTSFRWLPSPETMTAQT